tara:strand:+ start:118 stop:360 length:243 start_codon:yes stop_codon:yes gene_type:complete
VGVSRAAGSRDISLFFAGTVGGCGGMYCCLPDIGGGAWNIGGGSCVATWGGWSAIGQCNVSISGTFQCVLDALTYTRGMV